MEDNIDNMKPKCALHSEKKSIKSTDSEKKRELTEEN